eukprot:13000399-Ditylum_brightwellii.AAC.1
MERSKQIECVDGDKNNGVDDSDDNNVDNSVGNSDDGADKHLTHLTKADDCCLTERHKQIKCVDDDNGDGVDNGDDGGDKHLTHLP